MEDIGLLPKPTNDPPVHRHTVTAETIALHHISTGEYRLKQCRPVFAKDKVGLPAGLSAKLPTDPESPRFTPQLPTISYSSYSNCSNVIWVSWKIIKLLYKQ